MKQLKIHDYTEAWRGIGLATKFALGCFFSFCTMLQKNPNALFGHPNTCHSVKGNNQGLKLSKWEYTMKM